MTLNNDELTIWEVAFRWSGLDPDRLWLAIPLPVRDNIRRILNAIYLSELDCWELTWEKWHPDTGAVSSRYIGHHINTMMDCIEGRRFKRSFLRKIHVERLKVQVWTDNAGIKFPEFWSPVVATNHEPTDPPRPPLESRPSTTRQISRSRKNPHKDAMRELARKVWDKERHLSKIEVAHRIDNENMNSPKPVSFKKLQEWIADLDPRPLEKRRGRKRTIPRPANEGNP